MRNSATPVGRLAQVFWTFLRLGCTSFGGPIAHLGYFQQEFVVRKKWFTQSEFASWLALCQFLPGPASSQLGLLLGYARAGYAGAALAWLGFTLPSALILFAFAAGMGTTWSMPATVLFMLKILAVAVVAHALMGMLRTLGRSPAAWGLMTATCALALAQPHVWVQLAWMLVCAMLGLWLFKEKDVACGGADSATGREVGEEVGREVGRTPVVSETASPQPPRSAWPRAMVWFGLPFVFLLFALPWLRHANGGALWALADIFYRTGALVFGGGHTVLPWLQWELVSTGLVGAQDFLAGYSLAQAVPGPLFTFAAFLGALLYGGAGAAVALLCIFLPGTLLVFAALPVWQRLQQKPGARAALRGVNAAVIGLLAAAFYQPIWVSSIAPPWQSPWPLMAAVLAFAALAFWRVPAWALVLAFAAIGWALAFLP